MTAAKSGPAWPDRPKSLAEQLAASLLIRPPRELPTESDLDRVHGALESLLLLGAEVALLLGAAPDVWREGDDEP